MVVRLRVCPLCSGALSVYAGHFSCGYCGYSNESSYPAHEPSVEAMEGEERIRQEERARWRRDLFCATSQRRKENLQLKHNAQLVEMGRAVLAEMGLNQ